MSNHSTRRIAFVVAGIALLVPLRLTARPGDGGGPRLGPPAFLRHLYPPRLVMQNKDAIDLTDAQRSAIATAITTSRATLAPLEAKRDAAAEAVAAVVAASHIDETAAVTRAAELMSIEMDIKRAHLRLLIQVKNVLTAEQQATLDRLRADARAERRQRRRGRWTE